jgi:tetratricopeptide (TPR) repeat protein
MATPTPSPNFEEQLDRLEQYLQQDPHNPRLLVQAIDTALAGGDIAAARKHANTALDAHPGDPYMRHRHGNVLVAEGRLDEAAVIFQYLLALHGDPNIAYNLGLVRFRQGNYDAALKAVNPITDATPPRTVALAIRALHHQKRMGEAREVAERLLPRYANDAEVLAVASLVYLDEGDLGRAGELAQQSLQRGPRHLEALVSAATAALARQDAAGARALFKEALNINASDGRSLMGLGMAHLLAGDAANAKKVLERAIAQLPDNLDAQEALGWAHAMGGDLARAEEVFKEQLAKGDKQARRGLAVTYALQGRTDEANRVLAHLKGDDEAVKVARAIMDGGSQAAGQIGQLVRGSVRLH